MATGTLQHQCSACASDANDRLVAGLEFLSGKICGASWEGAGRQRHGWEGGMQAAMAWQENALLAGYC